MGRELQTGTGQVAVNLKRPETPDLELRPEKVLSLYIAQIQIVDAKLNDLPKGRNSRTGVIYAPQTIVKALSEYRQSLQVEVRTAIELVTKDLPLEYILSQCPTLLRLYPKSPAFIPPLSPEVNGQILKVIELARIIDPTDPLTVPLVAGRALYSKLKPEIEKLPVELKSSIKVTAAKFGDNAARYEEMLLFIEAGRNLNPASLDSSEQAIYQQWNSAFNLDGRLLNIRDSSNRALVSAGQSMLQALPLIYGGGIVAGIPRALVTGLGARFAARALGAERAEFLFSRAGTHTAKIGAGLLAGRFATQLGLSAVDAASFKELFAKLDGSSFVGMPGWKKELFWNAITFGISTKLAKVQAGEVGAASKLFHSLLSKVDDPAAKYVASQLLRTNVQAGGGFIVSLIDAQASGQLSAYEKAQALRYLGEQYLVQISHAVAVRGVTKGTELTAKILPVIAKGSAQFAQEHGSQLRLFLGDKANVFEILGVGAARKTLKALNVGSLANSTIGFMGLEFSYELMQRLLKNPEALSAMGRIAAWKLYETGFDVAKVTKGIGESISEVPKNGTKLVQAIFNAIIGEALKDLLPQLAVFKLSEIRTKILTGDLKGANLTEVLLYLEKAGLKNTADAVRNLQLPVQINGNSKTSLLKLFDSEIRSLCPDLNSGVGILLRQSMTEELAVLNNVLSLTSIRERKPIIPFSSGVAEYFRSYLATTVPPPKPGEKEKGKARPRVGEQQLYSSQSRAGRKKLLTQRSGLEALIAETIGSGNSADGKLLTFSVVGKNAIVSLAIARGESQFFKDRSRLDLAELHKTTILGLRLTAGELPREPAIVCVPIKFADGKEAVVYIPLSDLIKKEFFGKPQDLFTELKSKIPPKDRSRRILDNRGEFQGATNRRETIRRVLEQQNEQELRAPRSDIHLTTSGAMFKSSGGTRLRAGEGGVSTVILSGEVQDSRPTTLTISLSKKSVMGKREVTVSGVYSSDNSRAPAFKGEQIELFLLTSLIPYIRRELEADSITVGSAPSITVGSAPNHNSFGAPADVFVRSFISASLRSGTLRKTSTPGYHFVVRPVAITDLFRGPIEPLELTPLRTAGAASLASFANHLLGDVLENPQLLGKNRTVFSSAIEKLAVDFPYLANYRLSRLVDILKDRVPNSRLLLFNEWATELGSLMWYLERRGFRPASGDRRAEELKLPPATVFLDHSSSATRTPHAILVQARYQWSFGSNSHPADIDNILKLADAVKHKHISGATFELSGRVNPIFIQWLTDHSSELKNLVQIVYRVKLTDGSAIRLPLLPQPEGQPAFPDRQNLFGKEQGAVVKMKELIRSNGFLAEIAALSDKHPELFRTQKRDKMEPWLIENIIERRPQSLPANLIQNYLRDWDAALIHRFNTLSRN